MRVDVHIPGDELRDALRSHVERGLRACLAPHAARVRRASARLSEYFGDVPGSVSTRVRLEAELGDSPRPVVVEALAPNPYRAADAAAAALERALGGGRQLAA